MGTSYYERNKEKLLELSRHRYLLNKESIKENRKKRRFNETQEARQMRLKFHKKYNIGYKSRNYELSQTDEYKFKQYKFASKRRNHEFKLTEDLFTKLFHSNCTYCGIEDCRGIDRVDNNVGYTNNNSVPCCEICNKMKWKLDVDKFLSQIDKIYKSKLSAN